MSDKPKRMTREEIALVEVGHTDIGPGTARALVIAFLVLIVLVPVIDGVQQVRQGGLAGMRALDVVRAPPDINDFTFPIHRTAVEERNPFHLFESDVENASFIRTAFQTRMQAVLTGFAHGGNSKVVMGEGDWLFFRDGIDYVTYPGFLDGSQHQIRRRLQADPRPAILRMAQDCKEAGVRLVLVPVPDKAQIHPGKISVQYHDGQELDNPDFPRLLSELRALGIDVVETAPLLRELAAKGPAYLRQDTHWTPESMEAVAKTVATQLALPPPAQPRAWTSTPGPAARLGDLVGTLKLPEAHGLFQPQAVEIQQVADANGRPWMPAPEAEVLLLGDSFTNIYGDRADRKDPKDGLGWGESAGFAARLAFHLRRDLDVIAINGSGASGTRKELAKRPGQLAGKTLVVWQFSARDLAVSNWEIIPLTKRERPTSQPAATAGEIALTVRLSVVSAVKQPGTVPYTAALTTVKGTVLTVEGGTYALKDVLLVASCMEDNKLLDIARLREGDVIHVRLRPWEQFQAIHGTKNTYDDTEEFDLDRWWVESWSRK